LVQRAVEGHLGGSQAPGERQGVAGGFHQAFAGGQEGIFEALPLVEAGGSEGHFGDQVVFGGVGGPQAGAEVLEKR
jgi:hypothetical protein